MKWILINIFIILQSIAPAYGSNITVIEDLNYTDQNFIKLYESTVKSKNRLLKKERLSEYPIPNFYLYTLKRGEDIWTIIAKTSLNIDTIATLNRIDFIGDLVAGKSVVLPDLLGVFSKNAEFLKAKYPDFSKEIISINDPFEEFGDKLTKASLNEGVGVGIQYRIGQSPQRGVQASINKNSFSQTPVKKQSGKKQSPSTQVVPKNQFPKNQGKTKKIYFLPEVKLDFIEVAYIRGVVFHPPLSGVESSGFGLRKDPFINELTFHGGVDIAAAEGKPVRAARWGKVIHAGSLGGYGNAVIIQHELGYASLYGHLKDIAVEVGQNVETGEVIGTVGSTGKSTGPHLHFEIRRGNDKLNPENIPFFFIHK